MSRIVTQEPLHLVILMSDHVTLVTFNFGYPMLADIFYGNPVGSEMRAVICLLQICY